MKSLWTGEDKRADEPDDTSESTSEKRLSGNEAVEVELTREMREELLDPEEWSKVLDTYASTMGLAVALTDCEGRQLGICHNAQPAWLMAEAVTPKKDSLGACSFCIGCLERPCHGVVTALSTGVVELVRDNAGMVHLAIPLSLGQHQIGALIAGQVFDQYPEPLRLQRLARQLGISHRQFWERARLQSPIRNITLHVYGDLLLSLGKAFLRQRYAVILDRSLERANRRLRLSVDGVKNHALFTVDRTGLVTSWNLGAKRLFGYRGSDIIGQNFSRLFSPEDIQTGIPGKLLERADHDGWINDQGWQVRRDGTRFFSQGSLSVLGTDDVREFGRLTHDVTDERTAEEGLRQSQKLESIGVLAGGIAHDFNNLLGGILGSVSLAKARLTPDHPAYPSLAIAEMTTERAAGLTSQLLAYAGQGKFVVTRFDFSVLIRDMLVLLQTSIPKLVDLHLELEDDLPWIEADASQIQQIVMNLVINGAESIGPEGGSLRVSTRTEPANNQSEGQSGVQVCLEVRDTGSGMTDETKARIFDPFFTTKLLGRGLGLAAVSGIVRGHRGTMHVESEVGEGTTFQICFPAVEKNVEGKESVVAQRYDCAGGTVLVVDDDEILRMLARTILEHSGYNVLIATNGRDAVDVFRQHANTITAVLLDMNMPVMNGDKAFSLIREIRANVPIVVSTGYAESMTRALFNSDAVVEFIQKPYTAAHLCEKIRTTSRPKEAVSGAGRS
jgi:PAS domain S-box-containing protein